MHAGEHGDSYWYVMVSNIAKYGPLSPFFRQYGLSKSDFRFLVYNYKNFTDAKYVQTEAKAIPNDVRVQKYGLWKLLYT